MIKQLINITKTRNIGIFSKVWLGSKNQPAAKYTEAQLITTLKLKFPDAKKIQVEDVSGGCGAMYEISVESNDFQGLSTIKQHRLITDTLKNEIKDMHGIRIFTSVPNKGENK